MEAERKVRKKIPDLYVYVIVKIFERFLQFTNIYIYKQKFFKIMFCVKKKIGATFYAIRDSL